jgi:hypothetical protein
MMMMKTNPVRPAPNPTYTSYFHPIWMIWKIRNMVGTHWELKGNTVGTHIVNQGKMRKIPHPTPLPPKTSKDLPRGPKSLQPLYSRMNLNTISLPW